MLLMNGRSEGESAGAGNLHVSSAGAGHRGNTALGAKREQGTDGAMRKEAYTTP